MLLALLRKLFEALKSLVLPQRFPNSKQLVGQIALVTGAGNGIGREIAIKLAMLKCILVLWDIDETANEETKAICESSGAKAYTYRVDVSNRKEIYTAADRVLTEVGPVKIVVNNAGVLGEVGNFLSKSDEVMEMTIRVNMMAHIWMAKAFLPTMMEHDAGHIVSICSASAIVGAKFIVDYSASKFGAFGFQEALENEMYACGRVNIGFTTVCPSYIQTRMTQGVKIPSRVGFLSVDYVAEEVVNAILSKKRLLLLPKTVHLLYALKGLLPRRTFQRLVLFIQE